MSDRRSKQRLVDLVFEIGLITKNNPEVQEMQQEEYIAWIRKQLTMMGFKTRAQGMSWGLLIEDDDNG